MSKDDIFKQVQAVVAKHFDVDKHEIKANSDFKDDLDADSIDTIELIMALESKFNVNVDDKEAYKLKTVGDAVSFISKQLK